MIRLTVKRPNTVGVTLTKDFETPAECELYVERKVELLADMGWSLSEISGSSSTHGTIECTHDDRADTLLISWRKL